MPELSHSYRELFDKIGKMRRSGVVRFDRSNAVELVSISIGKKPLAAAIVDALESLGLIECEDSTRARADTLD